MAAVAPAMLVKLAPLSLDTCHWTLGDGLPEAPAVKLAVAPTATVWPAGCVVTAGGLSTT